MALLLARGADPAATNRYGDGPADDAPDDDTLHAFVLHAQRTATAAAQAALPPPMAAPAAGTAGEAEAAAAPARPGGVGEGRVAALGKKGSCRSKTAPPPRSSSSSSSLPAVPWPPSLRRCLRFADPETLAAVAPAVCRRWAKSSADPRLRRAVLGAKGAGTGKPE